MVVCCSAEGVAAAPQQVAAPLAGGREKIEGLPEELNRVVERECAVGVVGGAGRLEYAAVGSAVNLASRLCEEAEPGEVLVAGETVAAIDATGSQLSLEPSTPRRLKGFADEVATFALRPA